MYSDYLIRVLWKETALASPVGYPNSTGEGDILDLLLGCVHPMDLCQRCVSSVTEAFLFKLFLIEIAMQGVPFSPNKYEQRKDTETVYKNVS